jgi:uncharacterized membrane protein (Fun14 family)
MNTSIEEKIKDFIWNNPIKVLFGSGFIIGFIIGYIL